MPANPLTPEQLTLQEIRRCVLALPRADQDLVHAAAKELCDLVQRHGSHGAMAFALVGAQLAAED